MYEIIRGDCVTAMRAMPDNSVDSVVCDPPYELGFMGKAWDGSGIAFSVEMWREALRVLKPGGHLLAFGGSRTYHRMACAIEDAGFEIRDRFLDLCGPATKYGPLWDSLNDDQRGALAELLNDQLGLGSEMAWTYGSGFPKSLSVPKAISTMVDSRYGKETKCDCLDCGNGRPAGNDAGRAGGENVRVQRDTGQQTAGGAGGSFVPVKPGAGRSDVCELRRTDVEEGEPAAALENPLLLARVCGGGAEASGLGNVALRAGVEEQASRDSAAGQGLSMLREDARTEQSGATCPPPEAVQGRRDEPPLESSGSLRSVPPPDRGGYGSGFAVDPGRCEPRRIILDDQCGWPSAVARVCSWCARPSQEWLDSTAGFGTALKPSHEPICVARKPLAKGCTVATNVLQFGTGGLNIDGCRVPTDDNLNGGAYAAEGGRAVSGSLSASGMNVPGKTVGTEFVQPTGRWPANLCHDGSDEVLALFPDTRARGNINPSTSGGGTGNSWSNDARVADFGPGDSGSAARFFYCAKASRAERNRGMEDPGPQFRHGTTLRQVENTAARGNTHATVKPLALMRYLLRLVTPPGGHTLDPFLGSGTTIVAALQEGFRATGIELLDEHADIAERRAEFELCGDLI